MRWGLEPQLPTQKKKNKKRIFQISGLNAVNTTPPVLFFIIVSTIGNASWYRNFRLRFLKNQYEISGCMFGGTEANKMITHSSDSYR